MSATSPESSNRQLPPSDAPVALVTGASSGLGRVIAETFFDAGYRVVLVARSESPLQATRETLASRGTLPVESIAADVSRRDDCVRLAEEVGQRLGRLDVLVNCVGASDRGLASELTAERLGELIERNVTTALLCSQAMLPLLERSRGCIVNIGSLAGKVGARYLGGYIAAKHALTGLTQQLRLELRERGVHVALVSPGPIRRADAGTRYADRTGEGLPASATAPGGGTRVKGLDPARVARAVLHCAQHRRPDVVLPAYLRGLIAIGNALPRLGDWLLLKFTS